MNELIALDPQSLLDRSPKELERDLFQINREFGFEHGRFIAQYPHAYAENFWKAFNSISQVNDGFSMSVVKRRLEIFLSDLLPTSATYDPISSWPENAHVKNSRLFDAIVSDSSGYEVYTFDELLSGGIEKLQYTGRETKVVATPANYTKIIRPLILASSEVYIADRYFPFVGTCTDNEVDRGIELLSNLIAVAEENQRCKLIVILSDFAHKESRDWSVEKKDEKVRETIAAVKRKVGKGVTCKLGFDVVKGRDLIDIHERYVFSMKGCIAFDKGLVCDGKTRKVSYESRPSHEMTLNKLRKYMKRRS